MPLIYPDSLTCVFSGTVRTHRRVLHCPMACAGERSRGARPPGWNWVHHLVKLQQILTVVRLPSNLRDNWSKNEQYETSRGPPSGMYVSNVGPKSPTPVHNAASINEAQTCWGRVQSYEVSDGTASRAAGVRLENMRGSRLRCVMNRTTGQPDNRTDIFFFLAQ